MKKLFFTPFPYPEESPTSLVKRAALLNGYPNCQKLFYYGIPGYCKTNHPPLLSTTQCAKFLMEQHPEHSDKVRSGFYAPSNTRLSRPDYLINGISVPKKLINYTSESLCSECVKDGFEKYIKDIRLSQFCPYHNRTYIKACPHCQKKLHWNNHSNTTCSCKRQLISPNCSSTDSQPEQYLLRIFQEKSQEKFNIFYDSLRSLNHSNENPDIYNRLIFTFSASIACNDLDSAAEALQAMFPETILSDTKLMRAIFSTKIPEITKTQIINRITPSLSTAQESTSKLLRLSLRQAAKYLQLSPYYWRTVRVNPDFPKRTWRAEKLNLSELKALQKLQPTPQNSMPKNDTTSRSWVTLKRAASILQVNLDTLRELLNAGLLYKRKRPNDRKDYIPLNTIYKFNKSFICRQCLAWGLQVKTAMVLKAIDELGILPLALPSGKKYTTVITRKDARVVSSLLLKETTPALLPPNKNRNYPRNISIEEAGKILGISLVAVTLLRNENFICCTAEKSRNSLKLDSVERFKKQYISASEIQKIIKIPRTKVTRILSTFGIAPAICREMSTHRAVFYERSDISSELIENISKNRELLKTLTSFKSSINFSDACTLLRLSRTSLSRVINIRGHSLSSKKKISPNDLEDVEKFLSTLTNIREIQKLYKISLRDFNKLFFKSGFVQGIRINGETFLNITDYRSVKHILDNYTTCSGSDNFLSVPSGFTANQIKIGKLSSIKPFAEAPDSPRLLSIEKLRQFLLDIHTD
ncbi:hypothetical protein [Pseudomonas sp. C9-3]|uniref:hypothetical protein n=1 Tax=Pseudomonas sp. C9-3 TaxID=3078264 RepID=UPI0028ED0B49|nr:hypothetical protein [Pseudomonas sp. C9-3]